MVEVGSGLVPVPGSITRPLNFRSFMSRVPGVGFDSVPFLDVILIFVFLGIGSSSFVFSPGVEVDLVQIDSGMSGSVGPTAVLTVMPNEQFFFEGRKIPRDALESALKAYAEALPPGRRYLLLKVDLTTSTEESLAILSAARRAGFDRVQMAGEERLSDLKSWREERR